MIDASVPEVGQVYREGLVAVERDLQAARGAGAAPARVPATRLGLEVQGGVPD